MEKVTNSSEYKARFDVGNKELNKYFRYFLEFYNQSIILRTIGSVAMIDSPISALREKTNNKEQKRMLQLIEFELNRLKRLSNIIEKKVNQINENKIDWDFIKSEEFLRIVFDTFEKAKKEYREEKLKYFANILLNYTTYQFSNDFYKEGIIERISKYSVEHIIVLEEIYKCCTRKGNINDDKIDQNVKNTNANYIHIDKLNVKNININIVNICIGDLSSGGFIIKENSTWEAVGGKCYSVTDYGIRLLQLIGDLK
ncbi:hypothetical protein [Tepidibacter hydrothermalis]|uniref:Uncharacterized protein n=1 Tax=Tepidibacter hydrothermalis TaxID=3036126 RepID=A0ABY8EC09_9FIRM|nr:hypothetical protein [Tepidibacter hydrothermalis]WFD09027.1 hypothetical protein P4S50_11585 [Tepidibacter hydrothermalis]